MISGVIIAGAKSVSIMGGFDVPACRGVGGGACIVGRGFGSTMSGFNVPDCCLTDGEETIGRGN